MHDLMNIEARPRSRQNQPTPRLSRAATPASMVGSRYLVQQLVTGLPLVTADVLAMAVVCWTVSLFFGTTGGTFLLLIPNLAIALIAVNAMSGLYPAVGIHPSEEFRKCCISTSAIAVTSLALAVTSTNLTTGHVMTGIVIWIGLLVALPMIRSGTRMLVARFDCWAQPVLIVGNVREGAAMYREMQANRIIGLRPAGIIGDPTSLWTSDELVGEEDVVLCIGTLDDAASIAEKKGIFRAVIIADGRQADQDLSVEKYLHNIPHRLYIFERQQRDECNTLFAESTRSIS